MLADTQYLEQLYYRGYFYDANFQEYLKGLGYLFEGRYLRLIRRPEGLWNLKSLINEGFI